MKKEINLPKWFRLARIESQKSNHKQHKIGCVLVKGGSILSTGINQIRYKAIGSSHFTKWKESLHAERDALSKCSKEDIRGSSLYIYRENANGIPALSKPCSQCSYMLNELGVKKVYFTINFHPYYNIVKL